MIEKLKRRLLKREQTEDRQESSGGGVWQREKEKEREERGRKRRGENKRRKYEKSSLELKGGIRFTVKRREDFNERKKEKVGTVTDVR